MQLRNARLCLDCEELHEERHCPVCASKAYAFLTRWVPANERRRTRHRPPKIEPQDGASRWARRGAAGLAVLAAGRWLWKTTAKRDEPTDGGQ